jgi:hypothetical protein
MREPSISRSGAQTERWEITGTELRRWLDQWSRIAARPADVEWPTAIGFDRLLPALG